MTAGVATLRRATVADNAARCELFGRITMDADLVLSVRRDPDFDALYRLQTRDWLSIVIEIDGVIEGMATFLVRDGYVRGAPRRVGYLGDLRFSPRAEGRALLDRFYGPLLAEVGARFGCEVFLTAVIASNRRAERALVRQTSRSLRAGRPTYTPVGAFDIRSVHLLLPAPRARSPWRVRRATPEDVPALARFLDDDARARPFGFVFTTAELRRRLTEWPGLSIESFYLADDGTGAIAGCLATWDAAPVKRTVVQQYAGTMKRVRWAYDATATLLRRPTLPAAGQAFRYQYATHVAVPSQNPEILRALLARACADARAWGTAQFISVCVPHGSPMAAAFQGLFVTDLPARLYAVALPDVDASEAFDGAWPGFEMALV